MCKVTRFVPDTWMICQVQIPLIIGCLFGTFLYLSIFNSSAVVVDHRRFLFLRNIDIDIVEAGQEDKSINRNRSSKCRQNMRIRFKHEFPAEVEFPLADDCSRWYGFADAVRNCTIDYFDRSINDDHRLIGDDQSMMAIVEGTAECCSKGLYEMLSVTPFVGVGGRDDDTKWIVFPASTTLPCYTLSIGRLPDDLSTDRKLRRVMPQCEQHAAVNDKTAGKRFESIGEVHYVSLMVASSSADKSAADQQQKLQHQKKRRHKRKAAGPAGKNETAKTATVSGEGNLSSIISVSFTTLLKSHVKASEIDYLFVRSSSVTDRNSSNEYSNYVIRWLVKQRRLRLLNKPAADRIPVCFVTLDFHHHTSSRILWTLIRNVILRSDYLILSATKEDRIFLLNAYEPFCVEKYFGQWCQPPAKDEED